MLLRYLLIFGFLFVVARTYTNNWASVIRGSSNTFEQSGCKRAPVVSLNYARLKLSQGLTTSAPDFSGLTFETVPISTSPETDPIEEYDKIIRQTLFGEKAYDREEGNRNKLYLKGPVKDSDKVIDALGQYPSGNVLRAELFQGRSGVHLPMTDFMQKGHSFLKITDDYMQTAVNAFSIFLEGSVEDILRLPASYVLKSARTIAMMKIAKEKLAATWTVVKGDNYTDEVSYKVLQMYRPLFKYLNGREIARLNLSDPRILTYIGTHADLDRHQVGVVASTYLKLNPRWSEPKYLNMMNNLLCGVPMTFMRRIPENTYLQLSHQVFYHIRACDPLQRRFYLTMMTKTQALGKSYSWSARDVSRLGLLLSDVEGPDLAAINPEAMSGITAQVMLEIPPESLKHITEMQLRYISQKPLNILAKRLRVYQDQLRMFTNAKTAILATNLVVLVFIVYVLVEIKYW